MKNPIQVVLVLALALSCMAQSISTTNLLSYAFPFNGTIGALNKEYLPVYSLGTLSENYTISGVFNLPNLPSSSVALTAFVAALNGSPLHGLMYMDPTSNTLTKANGITYAPPTDKKSYQMSYKITFPTGSTFTSAPFYFVMTYPIPLTLLYYYTLELYSFPSGTIISVGSANVATTLIKITDFLRQTTQKIVYVAQPNQVFNFTAFPAAVCSPSCTENFVVSVSAITTTADMKEYGFNGNELTLGAATVVASKESALQTPAYTSNIAHYSHTFTTPGFYLLDY